jgi:hypothetical protein
VSVDGAFGHDPLTRLTGDGSDQIEVGVIVHDGQFGELGGAGDNQVRYLATTLMLGGEQSLSLLGSANVLGGCLDELESFEVSQEFVPLGGVAGGKADLEIADWTTAELGRIGLLFEFEDGLENGWVAETRKNAGLEQMGQCHASSRGRQSILRNLSEISWSLRIRASSCGLAGRLSSTTIDSDADSAASRAAADCSSVQSGACSSTFSLAVMPRIVAPATSNLGVETVAGTELPKVCIQVSVRRRG